MKSRRTRPRQVNLAGAARGGPDPRAAERAPWVREPKGAPSAGSWGPLEPGHPSQAMTETGSFSGPWCRFPGDAGRAAAWGRGRGRAAPHDLPAARPPAVASRPHLPPQSGLPVCLLPTVLLSCQILSWTKSHCPLLIGIKTQQNKQKNLQIRARSGACSRLFLKGGETSRDKVSRLLTAVFPTRVLFQLENYIQDNMKKEMVEMQQNAVQNQTAVMIEIGTNLLNQTAEQTRKLTDVEAQVSSETGHGPAR